MFFKLNNISKYVFFNKNLVFVVFILVYNNINIFMQKARQLSLFLIMNPF